MDRFKNYLTIFCIALGEVFLYAQTAEGAAIETAQFECEIIQSKEKLQNKKFISSPDLKLRANNEELVYAMMKLGKRGHSIFIYIRIIDKNVCIKNDQVLEIQYVSGEKISYKNDYPVNCDGIFVRKLDKREVGKIIEKEIDTIRIYTYQKNYDFSVNSIINYNLSNQIHCLDAYKIK